MSEHKLTRDVARAAQAKSLIDSELLTEAFDQLEKAYIDRWRATHIDDAQGREKLFLAVNLVGKVKDHLATVVANGAVAKAELDQIANEAERRKRFGII